MTWINDVASGQQIVSSWGNSIRDRVVANFTNISERDSHPSLTDGTICYTGDTKTVWLKRDGAWYPTSPVVVDGVVNQVTTPTSAEVNLGAVTSPLGFRRGVITYSGRSITNTYAATVYETMTFNLYVNGTLIFGTQQTVAGNTSDYRFHHNFSIPVNNNPATINTYQFNVSMTNPTIQTRRFVNDGSQTLFGVFIP